MAYHFFTEPEKLTPLQLPGKAYGPVDENEYRLCNLFTATSPIKAFAITSGNILVQDMHNSSGTVNLVIKPSEQPDLDMPKIDFIIYKGIIKSSIIVDKEDSISAEENSDLTRKIWASYKLQKEAFKDDPTTELPEKPLARDILGYGYSTSGKDSDLALDTESLNKAFYSNVKTLFPVAGGDHIGDFVSAKFGIMIVFEKIGFKPTFKLAREADSTLSFTALAATASIADKFKRKHDKETSLAFIDSCAFFGAFHSEGLKCYNGTGFETKSGQALYDLVTSKHFNANKIYLDIRNEYDDSFNYYENYKNEISLVLDNLETFVTFNYYRNQWPVMVIENSEFAGNNASKIIKLALPNHDNEYPLIYLKRAFRADIGLERLPRNREKFLTPIGIENITLTKLVRLNQHLAVPNLKNQIIANYFQLKYIKRVKVDDDQDTGPDTGEDTNLPRAGYSLFKRTYLDNIFPIFDMEIPFSNPTYTNLKLYYDVAHIDKILVKDIPQREILGNYTLRDYTANIGIASDVNSITFISFPFAYNSNIDRNNSIIPLGGMEAAGDNPFLIELNNRISSISLQKGLFTYNNNQIEYAKVVNNNIAGDPAFMPTNYNFDDVLIISVTREQYETLKRLKNQHFPDGYKVYLGIKDITSIVSNRSKYTSFKLVLRGLRHVTATGTIDAGHAVDTDITLFTEDKILGISSGHTFPLAKAYIEEDYGERVNGTHKGIDMETTSDAATARNEIFPAMRGTINKIIKLKDLKHHGGTDVDLGGIRVRILGDNGYYYNYFHLEPGSNDELKEEQRVDPATIIGKVGLSGFGYGIHPTWKQFHLHFEILKSVDPYVKINPYRVFPELALLPTDHHRGR